MSNVRLQVENLLSNLPALQGVVKTNDKCITVKPDIVLLQATLQYGLTILQFW
jgi:hypothetical protein